jgi:hypothetical protein
VREREREREREAVRPRGVERRALTGSDMRSCSDMESGSNAESLREVEASRPLKRKWELIQSIANAAPPPDSASRKTISLDFFLRPLAVAPDATGARCAAVEFARFSERASRVPACGEPSQKAQNATGGRCRFAERGRHGGARHFAG